MRILYVITRSEHGGAQTHLVEQVAATASQAEVLVATGDEGFLTAKMQEYGVPCRVLAHLKHAPHLWHDVAAVRELSKLIQAFDPDLVHAHSGKAGLLARIAAFLEHVPSIYTAHGFHFAAGHRRGSLVSSVGEWVGSRVGDFTIAVSESECRLAVEHGMVPKKGLTVIHNGVSDLEQRARPQLQPPVVAMVARFAAPKQQRLLLRAFARLAGESQLWLIGDGPNLGSVRDITRVLGIENRVLFWGDRSDVRDLLRQAQVAVLISDREAFGLSLVEAMSVGLPTVASDIGGMREIVQHDRTGFLVANEERELSEVLHRLCCDPALRVRMGRAARARYETNFTAAAMVSRTLEVYEAILTSQREANRLSCSAHCCNFPCREQHLAAGD